MSMKLPIDLTEKSDNGPSIPESVEGSWGPTVHFDWDEPYDFPDTGTMTVRFRVQRREESIEKDGEKKYHVCIELLELQKVKAIEGSTPPAKNYDEAGRAMDKLRAEMKY